MKSIDSANRDGAGRRGAFIIHIAFSRLCEHERRRWLEGPIVVMAALAFVSHAAVLGLAMTAAAAQAAEAELRPAPAKPACLNAAETREEVKAHRLLEPFAALKFAAAQRKAEALSAKLCHNGDDFIYEITLLHRDGRLVHVEMEADTGKLVSRPPREAHEPPVKN
jgi:uncharacterized membrane protein YkoI